MKKRIPYTATISLVVAIATCLMLPSCTDDSFPELSPREWPSGWFDKRPVLDFSRNFSQVVPAFRGAPAEPIA